MQHVVSEDWKLNRQMAYRQYGSWRDRNGLHMFIQFVIGPEKSGLFKLPFWHNTIMTACLNSSALCHIASGIGYLHSHIRSRAGKGGHHRGDGISFALEQCNQSIALLTSPLSMDVEVALIACVLFVCFEALHGNIPEAVQHCRQGRTLLSALETSEYSDERLQLLTPSEIRPIILGQHIQARCIPKMGSINEDAVSRLRAVQLSRFTHFADLSHAGFTLHSAYIDLLDALENLGSTTPDEIIEIVSFERAAKFVPWLQHWHQSFKHLLARSGPLSKHDSVKVDVLKVNYELVYIWATVDMAFDGGCWNRFVTQFRSMVDLSASVLRSHTIGSTPMLSSVRFPFVAQFLWVLNPLFLVMARCPVYELCWQAAQMLYVQQQNARKDLLSDPSATTNPLATDEWTVEEWIEFAQATDLDVGSSMFFGGFEHPDLSSTEKRIIRLTPEG